MSKSLLRFRKNKRILRYNHRTSHTCELISTVLDSPDPRKLAKFYRELLDFRTVVADVDWVKIQSTSSAKALSFQYEADYSMPVWPASGQQQQMMHLDIGVNDMDYAIQKALDLGAHIADFQPQAEVKVMLDPDGHPFCLFPLK